MINMSSTARTALVADDDAFFRMALRTILISQIGCSEVIEAGCFEEALERLGEHANISVAFFDLSMPGIKTPANLRVIRETFPNIRVVVVSASDSRRDVLMALEAGAHGYVPKSLGIADLTAALRLVLEGVVYVPPFLPEMSPTVERSCLGLTNSQPPRPLRPSVTRERG